MFLGVHNFDLSKSNQISPNLNSFAQPPKKLQGDAVASPTALADMLQGAHWNPMC